MSSCYVSHKNSLVVFWSYKCATTSMANWFLNLEGVCNKNGRPKFKELPRVWLHRNKYVAPYKEGKAIVEDKGYRSVHFTRDPYSRIVSSYINKFVIKNSRPLFELDKLEKNAIIFASEVYKSINKPIDDYSGFSFEQFLTHIEAKMLKTKRFDAHWDTQLPRGIDEYHTPGFIVKQETYDKDISSVNDELGLQNYRPIKANRTSFPEGFMVSDEDLSKLDSHEVLSKKVALSKRNLLTLNTKDKIYKLYRRDFEFFDYSR